MISFIGVVLLDVDYGLVIGVGVSIIMVIVKDQFLKIRPLSEYRVGGGFFDQDLIIQDKLFVKKK